MSATILPPDRNGQEPPPEVRLNALLADSRALTIAAAESCTGGEIAHRITAVSGSSNYFLGSIVSYSNEAKASLLGVPGAILERPGAVSEPTARAMATGARRAFEADLAVSTTGIAGPGGATERKPVGLVYIALAGAGGTICQEHHFAGSRTAVIDAAADTALRLLVAAVDAHLSGTPFTFDPDDR